MFKSSTKITTSGINGGEAWIDFEADDSLDEEEENDATDATSSIEQAFTRSSSNSSVGCEGTAALRGEAGVEYIDLAAFIHFLVCTVDGSTLSGLFTPVLIVSTPAFGAT